MVDSFRRRLAGSWFTILHALGGSSGLHHGLQFFEHDTEEKGMKKLKYGLIGCGDIAQKRVAPAIRELENCELVAVNRARYELAETFAREFGADVA